MELAKAYVQIVPSAEGISGKLNNALGSEAGSAGDAAGKVAGSSLVSAVKSILIAAGIGEIIKSAFTEGAALEQSIGGIETLFKDSSNKVIENAKNAYMTAGLSANDYMESVTSFSASLLQGLSGDTDKAADIADMALTDMSDNANKMGTDMESIQNAYQGFAKQNYTMLDNLKLGYGGTKSEMQRLLADAEKLSGVKYDLNNLSDVYSAIHVIQEDLDITGTTAKEAATTFSGSLASMKAAFSNVLGNLALGEDIGPALDALGKTVFTFVEGNLIPMAVNLLSGIPEFLSGIMYMASTALNDVFSNTDSIIDSAVGIISDLIGTVAEETPYFVAAFVRVIEAVVETFVNYDWLGTIQGLFLTIGESMNEASGEIFGSSSMLDSFLNIITESLPQVLTKGTEIVTQIANGIMQNIPALITTAETIVTQMIGFFSQNLPVWVNAGANLLLSLLNGVTENLPNITTTISTVFENILTAITSNLPNILNQGAEILLKLIDGIVKNFPKIVTTMGTMIINMAAAIAKNLPKIIQSGFEIIGKLVVGIIRAVPKLLEAIPGILEDLGSAFMDKDWGEIGLNIIESIVEGLKNAASMIWNALKDVAGQAWSAVKSSITGESSEDGQQSSAKGSPVRAKGASNYNTYEKTVKSMQENASEIQMKLSTGIQTENSENTSTDVYKKIGYEFYNALADAGLKIVVDKREIGRLCREVMA